MPASWECPRQRSWPSSASRSPSCPASSAPRCPTWPRPAAHPAADDRCRPSALGSEARDPNGPVSVVGVAACRRDLVGVDRGTRHGPAQVAILVNLIAGPNIALSSSTSSRSCRSTVATSPALCGKGSGATPPACSTAPTRATWDVAKALPAAYAVSLGPHRDVGGAADLRRHRQARPARLPPTRRPSPVDAQRLHGGDRHGPSRGALPGGQHQHHARGRDAGQGLQRQPQTTPRDCEPTRDCAPSAP